MRLHRHGTGAGTAAAMRRGEGLVQVDVAGVKAHVAGAGNAEQRVQIGAVHVDEAADVVHELRDFGDARFEQADRVGIGDHQRGDVGVEHLLQAFHINEAVGSAGELDHFVTGDDDGGGIGAVGAVGDDDLATRLAVVLDVVGAEHEQRREFALRAGGGLERNGVHAADFGQRLGEIPLHLQRALTGDGGLQRVNRGKAGHGRDVLR